MTVSGQSKFKDLDNAKRLLLSRSFLGSVPVESIPLLLGGWPQGEVVRADYMHLRAHQDMLDNTFVIYNAIDSLPWAVHFLF